MRPEHWTESTLSLYAPEAEKVLLSKTASPAERYAVSIRLCTSVLLHPKLGPELLAAVVDLLEAARFSVCEHRVAGVVPKGSPKLAARTARKALAALVHGSQGNRRGFSTVLLAQIVYGFQLSLAELQHDWRTIGDLRTMRERFPAELAEYRDTKLKQLLTGDLLEESAWLASKTYGISSDTFLRAWRQSPYLQRRSKERLLHDMKDGRFVYVKQPRASAHSPRPESHWQFVVHLTFGNPSLRRSLDILAPW